ncbi:methyltransferase domain-containing protein [Nesterenkonia pannonica]|uniref:methyltransferase domain-containing protein n=1 Tax=Nesterenkonia pannonica TaxID=1548602 RepID=UPI0021644902|nr:methyltransferase domain-containing protein [Nesterenkonia pannonica]
MLDLGSGGGDVLRRLSASRTRTASMWSGPAPTPTPSAPGGHGGPAPTVRFLCTKAETLLDCGETFDMVLTNHVIHHIPAAELDQFAHTSRLLATGLVLHNDIARSLLAYALFAAGITPVSPGTFLRTDGLRSIRRSYTPAELSRALGDPWTVTAAAPSESSRKRRRCLTSSSSGPVPSACCSALSFSGWGWTSTCSNSAPRRAPAAGP